jgi:hypothetical protein
MATTAGELVGDLAVADDRARNECRKQQQIERGVDRALLRGRVAAVTSTTDRMERVERDADGQQHLRDGNARRSATPAGRSRCRRRSSVLEHAEHDEVDADGRALRS